MQKATYLKKQQGYDIESPVVHGRLKFFHKNEKEISSQASTANLATQDIDMKVEINNVGCCNLETWKANKGEKSKEVGEEGHKYLGIVELDRMKEEEIKTTSQKQYFGRVKLVMQSNLSGRNTVKATNTREVSLTRYGVGITNWKRDELGYTDRRTTK